MSECRRALSSLLSDSSRTSIVSDYFATGYSRTFKLFENGLSVRTSRDAREARLQESGSGRSGVILGGIDHRDWISKSSMIWERRKKRALNGISALIYAIFVLLMVGPIMRESDQASLLRGSVELSRDGNVVGRSFYNYERQYGTYWVLAPFIKSCGLAKKSASLDSLVRLGNLVASSVFLVGLTALLLLRGASSFWELSAYFIVLSAPVIALSAPLLSSNIISAGFLCGAVVLLSGRSSLLSDVGCGLLAFCSVAARADAVLLFPALSLLSAKELKLSTLLGERRLWVLFLSSVLALLLGSIVSEAEVPSYKGFFQAKIFIAYFVFGLGATGLLLLLFCGEILKRSAKVDWEERVLLWLLAVAMVLPILFYGRILFSPRHLMTCALIVLTALTFPRGRGFLTSALSGRIGRCIFLFLLFCSIVPWVVGLRLSSLSSGSLTLSEPTVFPSADGYWPMGAYGRFTWWLKNADSYEIDHNQRVWNAWKVCKADWEADKFFVVGSGLASYGKFVITAREGQIVERKLATVSLIDSRGVTKERVNVSGSRGDTHRLFIEKEPFGVGVLGRGNWEKVFYSSRRETELDESWQIRQTLSKSGHGNDYVLGNIDSNWLELKGGGIFSWLFYDGQNVIEVEAGKWGWKKAPESTKWIARSALPRFMSIREFGK